MTATEDDERTADRAQTSNPRVAAELVLAPVTAELQAYAALHETVSALRPNCRRP